MKPQPIEYECNERGDIILPDAAPFDGSEVLIKLAEGWVQARWMHGVTTYDYEGTPDAEGFCWVCLDDSYEEQELDDAKLWCHLPDETIN